jgi:RNA polymerase primary sigma factor
MNMTRKNKTPSLPSVGLYLDEIDARAPLSRDEERMLAQRIRAGDVRALEKLVASNLKFVVTVAKSYQGQGLPLSDLIGEGNVGLIKAVYRFDETKGYKFISYAVWWIRQAILQALAEHARTVRLPMNRINAIIKVGRVTDLLQKRLGREPAMEEVARKLRMPVATLGEIIYDNARELSLDHTMDDDTNDNLVGFIESDDCTAPDEALSQESLQDEIEALLSKLDGRSAEIVRRYFGLKGHRPHSLEVLGQQFNLTRERVRQIKEKALQILRRHSHKNNLKEYL